MWPRFTHPRRPIRNRRFLRPRAHYSRLFALVRRRRVAAMRRGLFNNMRRAVGSRRRSFRIS